MDQHVDQLDEPQHDAQFSAHNKPNDDARRIRLGWVAIVAFFLVIGLAAVYIMTGGRFSIN